MFSAKCLTVIQLGNLTSVWREKSGKLYHNFFQFSFVYIGSDTQYRILEVPACSLTQTFMLAKLPILFDFLFKKHFFIRSKKAVKFYMHIIMHLKNTVPDPNSIFIPENSFRYQQYFLENKNDGWDYSTHLCRSDKPI